MAGCKLRGFLPVTALFAIVLSAPASAETLTSALVSSYLQNPGINDSRAELRALDEGVARAKSGWRPRLSATADVSSQYSSSEPGARTENTSMGVGLNVTQPIFRGFRTINSTRQAKAIVRAGRQNLRIAEQNVFLHAVQAFFDVLRDQRIVHLRRENVRFLDEQIEAARARLRVGEGTVTEVAEARARQSAGSSQISAAEAQLAASRASYREVIGHEPANLSYRDARRFARLLPTSLQQALKIGLHDHPSIISAIHVERAQAYKIKTIDGEFMPSINIQGTLSARRDPSPLVDRNRQASIVGKIDIPLYQAGEVSARARQERQILTRRQLQIDAARAQVRTAIVSRWSALNASRAQIRATRSQIEAAERVLFGVTEENKVGQRTNLDVLNAQRDFNDARIAAVQAQREYNVAGFSLLAALGRLDVTHLELPVERYAPARHYKQVKDKWIGLRTVDKPEGRRARDKWLGLRDVDKR